MPWRDIIALITIIAALVGFTFAGPGNVRSIAQAVFYVFTVVFLVMLVKGIRHQKPKEEQ